MAWTEPKTWTAEPLVASDLNTHLRDNLNELKDPPTAHYEPDEGADYTTTSTSFVNVDSTPGKLSLTINTNGGDVLVGFHGFVLPGANGDILFFDVELDGISRIGGGDGLIAVQRALSSAQPARLAVSFVHLISDLDADEHTFNLQWKITASNGTLFAGAGTANSDIRPQFWVREVS